MPMPEAEFDQLLKRLVKRLDETLKLNAHERDNEWISDSSLTVGDVRDLTKLIYSWRSELFPPPLERSHRENDA